MISFFRWLFGYVCFSFCNGFHENFINDCYKNKIDIKNIRLTEYGFDAICNIKTYKTLHRVALRHGGVVKIRNKKGLPFLLKPLKNRWGFFVGAVAFVFIVSFLSGFIWSVQIVCPDDYSSSQITSFLEENNVKSGTMWSSIDRSEIAAKMMAQIDTISWVHINKIGTTAVVEFNIAKEAPTADEDKLEGIKVFRKELDAVAYKTQSNIILTKTKNYKTLSFFGININLYIKKESGDMSEENTDCLEIKGVCLPVKITTQTEKFYRCEKYELSEEQMIELAKKKLSFEEDSLAKEYEIINSNYDYTLDDDKCVVTGSYIIREKNID